jgi:hypothetical protein
MTIDTRALGRGVAVGLAAIVPISVAVELLERNVDELDGSAWMLLPLVAILGAYVVAGHVAARGAPFTPLIHGALAALIAFGGWLAVRIVVPLVQGDALEVGLRSVVANAVLAAAFGLVGGASSTRSARV